MTSGRRLAHALRPVSACVSSGANTLEEPTKFATNRFAGSLNITLVLPLCIFKPTLRLSLFRSLSISWRWSALFEIRAIPSANLRWVRCSPSIFILLIPKKTFWIYLQDKHWIVLVSMCHPVLLLFQFLFSLHLYVIALQKSHLYIYSLWALYMFRLFLIHIVQDIAVFSTESKAFS